MTTIEIPEWVQNNRRRLGVGTAVLAVIVLLWAVLGSCGGSDERADSASNAPGEAVDVFAPPSNVRWVGFQGIETPHADQGPHTSSSTAPTGYDHSPAGAALAAINATIRMSVANDEQFPQVSRDLLAPGAGRDWFIANRLKISTIDGVDPAQAPKVIGYQVAKYTPGGTAEVTVFSTLPDGSVSANETTVVWSGGADWKLLLPTAEDTRPRVSVAPELPAQAVRLR